MQTKDRKKALSRSTLKATANSVNLDRSRPAFSPRHRTIAPTAAPISRAPVVRTASALCPRVDRRMSAVIIGATESPVKQRRNPSCASCLGIFCHSNRSRLCHRFLLSERGSLACQDLNEIAHGRQSFCQLRPFERLVIQSQCGEIYVPRLRAVSPGYEGSGRQRRFGVSVES